WAEAFGVALSSPEELKAGREEHEAAALRERDALLKKIRTKGVEAWNRLDYRLRERIDLRGIDLSGAALDELDMTTRDLGGANFAGSSLKSAKLWTGQLQGAVFTGADLENTNLYYSQLHGANFRDANLTNANLNIAKLQGADFTGATLKGAGLNKAQFDEKTVFPAGFRPPADMAWKGEGP